MIDRLNPNIQVTRPQKQEWSWALAPQNRGDDWRDYVVKGGLVEPFDSSRPLDMAKFILQENPQNSLFATAPAGYSPFSFYVGSPDNFPTGFWKRGTVIEIYKPNYTEGKLYAYRLKLEPESKNATALQQAVQLGIDEMEELFEDIPLLSNVDFKNLDDRGVWVVSMVTTSPLEIIENRGVQIDTGANDETDKPSVFPYLVSGLGIFTGSPILIGGGLLLRFLESRR